MASANWPDTPLDGTLEQRFRARSKSFMSADFSANFDDFDYNAVTALWAINGAPAISNVYGGGIVAFPAANAVLIAKSSGGVIKNPAATKWHLGGRMLLTAAMAASDIKQIALHDGAGTNMVSAGILQATSAVKYVFRAIKAGATVTALSTVSVDLLFHVIEIWFDGLNMYGSIDGETPVLVTSAANLPTVTLFERHGNEQWVSGAGILYLDVAYAACDRLAS